MKRETFCRTYVGQVLFSGVGGEMDGEIRANTVARAKEQQPAGAEMKLHRRVATKEVGSAIGR